MQQVTLVEATCSTVGVRQNLFISYHVSSSKASKDMVQSTAANSQVPEMSICCVSWYRRTFISERIFLTCCTNGFLSSSISLTYCIPRLLNFEYIVYMIEGVPNLRARSSLNLNYRVLNLMELLSHRVRSSGKFHNFSRWSVSHLCYCSSSIAMK